MSAPHPKYICEECGEYLPHYCAAIVKIARPKWAQRRVLTIVDRTAA